MTALIITKVILFIKLVTMTNTLTSYVLSILAADVPTFFTTNTQTTIITFTLEDVYGRNSLNTLKLTLHYNICSNWCNNYLI